VFGSIVMVVVTVMQIYVFWRATSVPLVKQDIQRKYLIVLGFALWALFILGRVVGSEETGTFAGTLELWGMGWMATLFLMSVALLAVDVATGFGSFFSRSVPRMRGAALAIGAVLTAVALVQGLRAPVVQSYDVAVSGLPKDLNGTVIVVLSDLHLGVSLGEQWLTARVDQVMAERPNVVVLLGDIFEGHSFPKKELLAALHRLAAPQGVWAVLGNHESYLARNNNTALFEQAGIRLLRNAWAELHPGLVLAGVNDLSSSRDPGLAEGFLKATLAGRPLGATILLSHAPIAPELAAAQGADLMLSGHTHGGQIWPFDYLVKQRFRFFEGRYDFATMTLIVSRGTGTWGPRMRLWRPAEIIRVTLHSS
jgi:predicted MPP superfamily phosphohydrolase